MCAFDMCCVCGGPTGLVRTQSINIADENQERIEKKKAAKARYRHKWQESA